MFRNSIFQMFLACVVIDAVVIAGAHYAPMAVMVLGYAGFAVIVAIMLRLLVPYGYRRIRRRYRNFRRDMRQRRFARMRDITGKEAA